MSRVLSALLVSALLPLLGVAQQSQHHLYTFNGDLTGHNLGGSVSGAGDVNKDGYADLIVGAHFDDNNGANAGMARVFSGCDALGTSYCAPAVPNSSGQPAVISACGSDLVSEGYVMLRARDLPPDQLGYFLTSRTQGFFMPPGSDGNICLGGDIGRFEGNVGRGPAFSLQIDLSAMPLNPPAAAAPGETWNFQAWYRDVGSGNNFTDGVSITYQ